MTRILVIGPSNIGDAVLIAPVIERLHQTYPQAQLTLLVGKRASQVFARDPRVHEVVVFESFEGWTGRLRLVGWLWGLQPQALVDLRHTILPLLWKPWRALRYLWPIPARLVHMHDRHLWTLARHVPAAGAASDGDAHALCVAPEEDARVDQLLQRWGVDRARPLVVICPGARSHIKRWVAERFAQVADRLIEQAGTEVIITGEADEASIAQQMLQAMRHRAHNAVSHLTIRQVAALMQRARLVITNDSASLHVATAMQTPVVSLFGPTDPRKYGPRGPRDRVIRRRLFCSPCEQPLCRFNHECMRFVSVEEVYDAAQHILRT